MLLLSMHHRADEKLCIFAPVQAGYEGWSHGYEVTSLPTISLWSTAPFAYRQPLKEDSKVLRNEINN